ncbi:MAG: DUF2520 domain-containing protein [Ruminococcus sp.]|nr:DUF2520 domain-containing protein [Ruminococcus sp.]
MRIGFIGAGKVGCTLGIFFGNTGLADIAGYSSRSIASAQEAAGLTGSRAFRDTKALIDVCDAVFITVPDGEIREVYEQIKSPALAGKHLCHCSGAMTADEAFPGLSEYGASGCSVHPLFPVSDKQHSWKDIDKAYFCLEGKDAELWSGLLGNMGLHTRMISGSVKSRYHAACAVMSNLVCALAAESIGLLGECGFPEEEALAALRPLAENNLGSIFAKGPSAALTGPVERCDVSTVRKHLECIPEGNDRELYRYASMKLVEVAQQKHPDRNYAAMTAALTEKGKK